MGGTTQSEFRLRVKSSHGVIVASEGLVGCCPDEGNGYVHTIVLKARVLYPGFPGNPGYVGAFGENPG